MTDTPSDDIQPISSFEGPRLRGVREHFERVQFLFDLARNQTDAKSKYRLMLAAIYSCRGMTEIMLEAAEKQEAKGLTRGDLEDRISPLVPYYALIECIRIHDFHRFGIGPPDQTLVQVMFGGPIKLTAQKGSAMVAITAQGPLVKTTGASQVRLQRPLLNHDGDFFDDQSENYVTLSDVLTAFIAQVPDAILEFEKLVSPQSTGSA